MDHSCGRSCLNVSYSSCLDMSTYVRTLMVDMTWRHSIHHGPCTSTFALLPLQVPSAKGYPLQKRNRRGRAGNPLKASLLTNNGSLCTCCHASKTAQTSYIQELVSRSSAEEVRQEMLMCYKLIKELGKGVVYLGSSRTKQDHPHFVQAIELGREVAVLLDCTTWTGAGPGMMDAVIKGALEAGKPVGGFKISKEAGEWTNSNFHPYLESHVYYTCRFFSARKHGLVDAAVRDRQSERTAFVALPGGIGTVDEVFEILTLMQLERIGSKYPVPFLLMNYDGFYTKLLDFLNTCKDWGSIAEGEVERLWTVCDSNEAALDYLAQFYSIERRCNQL